MRPTGAAPNHHIDLVVIGGGLGGCAAAIAAADAGLRVVLTEETDRVGGQVTSQLVSALDEHPCVEQFPGSATYGAFRNAVRAASGGVLNPGGGWVSRLCFAPNVGQRILEGWLKERGVRVLTGVRAVEARVVGDRVDAVVLDDGTTLRGSIFADATELGDLLPLTGTPWIVGSEGPAYDEPHALAEPTPGAVQSCTWCAVVEHAPQARFEPVPKPRDYDRWRDRYRFDIAGWDGTSHRYRMFSTGPDGRPPFWTYRQLISTEPRVTLLNWVSNDYSDASLIHHPERARREARNQTLGFVHWLQTEAPHDDDPGRGFPGIRLRPDVAGTPDGLAAAPYVRESRRLTVSLPVTGHDIAPVTNQARALLARGSVGVVHYHADLHPRVGAPATVFAETAPFQIPVHSLVTDHPRNLVVAGKNVGATQIAAAALRVHSGEWVIGEAAGTLAAQCVRRAVSPAQVRDQPRLLAALQRELVARGVAIAWTLGIAPGDDTFEAAQLLVAAGALSGPRLETLDVHEHGSVSDRERACMHRAAERLSLGRVVHRPPGSQSETWGDLVRHYSHHLSLPTRPRRSS